MDEWELALRAAREHLDQTEKRLAAGRAEIDRQNASVSATREHIAEIRRWLEEAQALPEDGAGTA